MDGQRLMEEKICLVTGSTSGIGRAAAQILASMGATVVVMSRNLQKCEATVKQIAAQTDNPRVSYIQADLSVQRDVHAAADQFKRRFSQLDVLINNAGAHFINRQESADGIEMTLALNHLSYFLLTNLLLDTLKDSAPARIVNVASAMQRPIDFDDLQYRRQYDGWRAYGRSKLANILFTRELARRLPGTGITANAVHPGMVSTGFVGTGGGISPEEGAETIIYLATSPDVARVTGQYFVKKRAVDPSPEALDDDAARRLWEISEHLTGIHTAI